MKTFRNLLLFLITALFIQFFILTIIDKLYLTRDKGYVEAIKIEDVNELKLPRTAAKIKLSYDGRFAAYLYNGKVHIVSVDNNKDINQVGSNSTFFKWLPDRNFVIYSEITSKGIEIKTLDIVKGDIRSYPLIKKVTDKSEVVDIELSPLTNTVYIEIKMNDYDMDVYKFDIMDNLKYVMTVPINTVIREMNYNDIVVYQKDFENVIIMNGNGKIEKTIPCKNYGFLLGIDKDDRIYIGETDVNKNINKIFIEKKMIKGYEILNEIDLKGSYSRDNLFITQKGKIITIKNDILNIVGTTHQMKLDGKIIDLLNDMAVIKKQNYFYLLNIDR